MALGRDVCDITAVKKTDRKFNVRGLPSIEHTFTLRIPSFSTEKYRTHWAATLKA
jgi:hypothetical protein